MKYEFGGFNYPLIVNVKVLYTHMYFQTVNALITVNRGLLYDFSVLGLSYFQIYYGFSTKGYQIECVITKLIEMTGS